MKKLIVQDTLVSLIRVNDDYISLTDIARVRSPGEYLGLWEKISNAAFEGGEFDSFKLQAG